MVVVLSGNEWWFVGFGEVVGMLICKGRRIRVGDEVDFVFLLNNKLNLFLLGKVFGRGKNVGICLEIVRFLIKIGGEV